MRRAARPFSWLVLGFALGVLVSWVLRDEPTLALTNDRADDTVVTTAPWDEQESVEMVYVLDTRRGRLVATAVNPITGRFLGITFRDVVRDFRVGPRGGKPKFAMVAGRAVLTGQTRFPVRHLLYVIELNSGRVQAYTTPFTGYAPGGGAALQIVPVDAVQWAQAIPRR